MQHLRCNCSFAHLQDLYREQGLFQAYFTVVAYPARMGTEVISIQDGGGMLTSSIRRAYGVRTKGKYIG